MRRSTKHAATRLQFTDFTGGINVAVSGEQIAQNEMQVCKNFIYKPDSRRLAGRGGLSKPITNFTDKVKDIFYDVDTNTFLVFLNNKEIYSLTTTNSIPNLVGNLTGSQNPVCCKFQDKLWIASGDKLQYYDFSTTDSISTVLNGPICDIVFERFARLAVVKTGNDRITYSGTGDGTFWTEDNSNDSSSKWIDVGYGDSGDIIAVVPLATDLIIFKSNGKIYQLCGDKDSASWVVYNISNLTDAIGKRCAVNVGNQVIFISRQGLKTVSTTMDYGNIATGDIGDKINKLITSKLYEPRIFNLRRHKTLLIRPTDDWSFFIAYNYALNAATTLKFSMPVTSIVETMDKIVIASNQSLYYWDEDYTKDSEDLIDYKIVVKDTISFDKILVKSIDSNLVSTQAGAAKLTIDKLSVDIPTNSRKKIRCNHSTEKISVDLTSNSPFEISHIVLEVADL